MKYVLSFHVYGIIVAEEGLVPCPDDPLIVVRPHYANSLSYIESAFTTWGACEEQTSKDSFERQSSVPGHNIKCLQTGQEESSNIKTCSAKHHFKIHNSCHPLLGLK